MHFKIPQGPLIQQKKKLERHICILFFSYLSHPWKWQVGYYSHDILNTLCLVSETCSQILLCTQSDSTRAILKESLKYLFPTVLYFLLLMAFRAWVVNTTLTTFLAQNYYSWSCQLQLCHGSLKINGYAAAW